MNDDFIFINSDYKLTEFDEQYINGFLKSIKKIGKKAIKSAKDKVAKDLTPAINLVSQSAKTATNLAKTLKAVNPSLQTVEIGMNLLKDIKETEKQTNKKVAYSNDSVINIYELAFKKGFEAAMEKMKQIPQQQPEQQKQSTIVEEVKQAITRSRRR